MNGTKLFFGIATTLVVTGCGVGNEPIAALGSSEATPQIQLAVQSNFYSGGGVTFTSPYEGPSSATPVPGFIFSFTAFAGVQQAVLAPASGLITAIAVGSVSSATGYEVTIRHSAHLSSIVGFLNPPNVRVGDYVNQGDEVGTVASTFVLQGVVLDGNTICPYGYMSAAARQTLSAGAYFNAVNPCID